MSRRGLRALSGTQWGLFGSPGICTLWQQTMAKTPANSRMSEVGRKKKTPKKKKYFFFFFKYPALKALAEYQLNVAWFWLGVAHTVVISQLLNSILSLAYCLCGISHGLPMSACVPSGFSSGVSPPSAQCSWDKFCSVQPLQRPCLHMVLKCITIRQPRHIIVHICVYCVSNTSAKWSKGTVHSYYIISGNRQAPDLFSRHTVTKTTSMSCTDDAFPLRSCRGRNRMHECLRNKRHVIKHLPDHLGK